MIFPENFSGEQYKRIPQMLYMKHTMDVIAESWADISTYIWNDVEKYSWFFKVLLDRETKGLKKNLLYWPKKLILMKWRT
jgi:cell wall assembly regulator SMI1